LQWNSAKHRAGLRQLLHSLHMPEIQVYETGDWRGLVDQVVHYLSSVTVAGQDCSMASQDLGRALAACYRSLQTPGLTSPPPSLLPWTHLMHILVTHRVQGVLGGHPPTMVVYKEATLDQWALPSCWVGGLGWGAQHLEQTVTEVLEDSLLEATQGVDGSPGCSGEYQHLAQALAKEQRCNMKFEALLEAALAGDREGPLVPSTSNYCIRGDIDRYKLGGEKLEEREEVGLGHHHQDDYSVVCGVREVVPVISCISPSLGALVSPLKVLSRQEPNSTGYASRNSPLTPGGRKRKLAVPHYRGAQREDSEDRIEARVPRLQLQQRIDTFKQDISEARDQDRLLEDKLRAALS